MDVVCKPEYKSAVQRIRDLYNEAEVDLKSYGREDNRLFVPGVNQLRYAGQHLVRALGAADEQAARSNLDAAERHAQRALYDINDAAIQYHLAGITRIRTQYFVNLNAIVPNYQEVVNAVRSARKNLERVSNEHKDNREQFYKEAREHVAKLHDAHEIMKDAIPDIAAEMKRQNDRTRLMRAGFWVAVIVLLLNFARFLVSLF